MKHAGPTIGLPFSLEGAAFFNDAWISQASHMTFAAFTAVGLRLPEFMLFFGCEVIKRRCIGWL
jgi:hypothetical protein